MTHPAYLRDKARQIRVEKRLTIDEIAERLALPRTTIYHWVKDIPIPLTSRQSEAQRRGTAANVEACRRRREAAYAAGRDEFDVLARDPTFRDFVCLYVAEGYKRNRNVVSIANSDPAVILVADRWLKRLADRPLSYSVQYHADQDLDEIRGFWGELVAVDPSRVRLLRKSNSNQLSGRTWRSVHGVLSVSVADTLLRARLQAWMDRLREGWL